MPATLAPLRVPNRGWLLAPGRVPIGVVTAVYDGGILQTALEDTTGRAETFRPIQHAVASVTSVFSWSRAYKLLGVCQNSRSAPVKYIERCSFPASPPFDSLALKRLRNTLAVSLLYTQDSRDHHWDQSMGEFGQWERELADHIRSRFYELVYVPRDAVDDIYELMKLGRLIVVRGSRGSGKSTALLKVLKDFQETETNHIHYIDLNQHRGDPRMARDHVHDGQERETVCAIIFRELTKKYFDSGEQQSRRDAWLIYRVRNALAYEAFWRRMLDHQPRAPETDEEWLATIRRPEYSGLLEKAHTEFQGLSGSHQLYVLLSFLVESEIVLHVLVDNIDRVSIDIQQAVVDRCMDLTGLVVPVVAVRNSNYQRLNHDHHADVTFLAKALRSASLPPLHHEAREKQLVADPGVLQGFIDRRFKVAIDYYAQNACDDNALDAVASSLGYSREKFFHAHLDVLKLIQNELVRAGTVSSLMAWHNHSMRTSASQIVNLINDLVSNSNPLYRITDLIGRHQERDTVRRLRSLTYRFIIFGRHRAPSAPETVNVFADGRSARETAPFHFAPLKLLEYLYGQYGMRQTWGEITKVFAEQQGIAPDTLFSALRSLVDGRGQAAPDGLIHVDLAPIKHAADMAARTPVELLPSGLFFLERLSTSCEYLFWMALHTDTPADIFGNDAAKGGMTIEHIDSDVLRAKVAVRFLRHHLLPKFLAEHNDSRIQPAARKAAFSRHVALFTKGFRGLFPERAADALRGFIDRRSVSYEDRVWFREELGEVDKACNQLWKTLQG